MTPATLPTLRTLVVSLLTTVAICSPQAAAQFDQTFNTPVVVPSGTNLDLAGTNTYNVSLTIEAGANITNETQPNARIVMGPGAVLNINGTELVPVRSFTTIASGSPSFAGFVFQPGSVANINHLEVTNAQGKILVANDATVNISNSLFTTRSQTQQGQNSLELIRVNAGSELTMDGCTISRFAPSVGPFGGVAAGTGGPGYNTTVFRAIDADRFQITNSRFFNLFGGQGGTGGTGGSGRDGSAGANGDIFNDNGRDGSDGTPGGPGGQAGGGGRLTFLTATNTDNFLFAQNILDEVGGGRGGLGGFGGRGGDGGRGGNGLDGILADGGNAGDGGDGGNGGRGGTGGVGGDSTIFDIIAPPASAIIANNTLFAIRDGLNGQRGSGGPGGAGGARGTPGEAGTFGDDGLSGSNGRNGTSGAVGSNGPVVGDTQLLRADAQGLPEFAARFNNNIVRFFGGGTSSLYLAEPSPGFPQDTMIDATFNATFLADVVSVGSVSTSPIPGSISLDSNYVPEANSTAVVDTGNSQLVPVELEADIYGNPRLMDDLSVVNTGVGFGPQDRFITDIGAVERPGEFFICQADFNGDGFVEAGDIAAFIEAFLSADPAIRAAADINGDGFVESGDIAAFVAAFLEGC